MALSVGRKGQVYLKKEAAYGVEETLSVAEALRHIEIGFGFDPFNRVTSPEKKQSPGPVNRFDRKKTAELANLIALLRPSGVLNTLPEAAPLLEAAFGSFTNETLATTVEAAPAPTTTGATVLSAGTLVIGDAVLIEVTGQNKSPFVRILTGVAGAALTWAPALPAAPATGDDLKGGITYKLTTDLAISLTIAHYLDAKKRELLGAGIDQCAMMFDANEEPRLTLAGPAKEQLSAAGVQSQPAGFTTVGGNPPSGIIGELYVDDTEHEFKSLEVALSNTIVVRNQEYGVNGGTEIYRQARREITLALETFADDPAILYEEAVAGNNVSILKQTGKTEGNIVAIYAPRVEWKVPEQDDPDEEVNWSYSALALETADGENDELTLALM
ncbi:MAG: hypothetical protein GY769_01780 [bacterium]|nr:hypothetical protein [bacterium]